MSNRRVLKGSLRPPGNYLAFLLHPHQRASRAATHAPLRRHRRGRPRHRRLRRRRRRRCCSAWRAPAGGWWRPRAGPVLGSRTATGSATSPAPTTSTGPNPRVIGGDDPVAAGLEQLAAAASAAPWCTTPATRRASIPPTSDAMRGRRRRRLADRLRRPAPLLRATRERAAGRRASTGPGGIRTATRTLRTRLGGTASTAARREALGHRHAGRPGRDHQRRGSGTARTASTAASACRAAR